MSRTTPTQALLLAAHGSLKNGQSSNAVFEHARRIREKGIFHEVRAIFWKEEPYFHQAVEIAGSDLIYVVPFFMSQGYFTRQILPRELSSSSSAPSNSMIITAPVGTHPDMLQILLSKMRKAIPNEGYNKSAVALIGHGTPKDEESSEAIYHLAGQIRRQSRFSNVKCFFLDEEPLIEGLADAFETDDIHIFPIFIGEGLHTQIDIPERLGFAHERPVYGTHLIQDSECTLNYHPPLGVLPESTDIIMQRLIESGATITSQGSADSQDTRTYLRPAAQFFLELLNSRTSEKSLWGELVISADGDDTFEIRHTDDEPASSNLLKTHTVDDAWHIAKWDLHGDYRPLKSRPGLQSGWIIRQLSASELIQALDYFYPASIDSVYRSKQGQLNMTQFKHIASRQSGLYRKTRQITRDELRILVERCCHANACLKSNLWFEPERHKNTGSERLLCSAPCAVLMDETRTIAMQTHSKKFYKEQLQ